MNNNNNHMSTIGNNQQYNTFGLSQITNDTHKHT